MNLTYICSDLKEVCSEMQTDKHTHNLEAASIPIKFIEKSINATLQKQTYHKIPWLVSMREYLILLS